MAETKSDNSAGLKRIKQYICDHLMEPIKSFNPEVYGFQYDPELEKVIK